MREITTDIAVIGAGSAGLSAAYQAASAGANVLVIDENHLPGGQLFKQIHKFFGSRAHQAGTRGFQIGQELLERVQKSWFTALNATARSVSSTMVRTMSYVPKRSSWPPVPKKTIWPFPAPRCPVSWARALHRPWSMSIACCPVSV